MLLEGGKISTGSFASPSAVFRIFRIWYDIYISFLDWVGIIHSGIIFSFLSSTFFWRRSLLDRFHSFFFWNTVRIWFWIIPNGLLHQCPGTGSCSVVKKVTMSEKKYKWNTISPGRDFDIFCRWVLQIKQLIYTISLANKTEFSCLHTMISLLLIVTGPHWIQLHDRVRLLHPFPKISER